MTSNPTAGRRGSKLQIHRCGLLSREGIEGSEGDTFGFEPRCLRTLRETLLEASWGTRDFETDGNSVRRIRYPAFA